VFFEFAQLLKPNGRTASGTMHKGYPLGGSIMNMSTIMNHGRFTLRKFYDLLTNKANSNWFILIEKIQIG
jgi:hypothetical protein